MKRVYKILKALTLRGFAGGQFPNSNKDGLIKVKKSAFTLAEVLITITALGIISVIVVPNIVRNYNERMTVTRVKKFYSTLTTAYGNMFAEGLVKEGELFGYTRQGAEQIADLFKPYFSISMDCGTLRMATKKMPGKVNCGMYDGAYKTIKGKDTTYYANNDKYYAFKLKDGSVIWLRGYDETHTTAFWYDVNGNKGPNTFGKDVFHFSVTGKDVLPIGGSNTSFESKCVGSDANGLGCTAWVVNKGNLDYLKCGGKLTYDMKKCP